MTYFFLVWIAISIGFVLGATWTGLCMKNREADQQIARKVKDFYPNAQKGGM